jgi:hypothetical protein
MKYTVYTQTVPTIPVPKFDLQILGLRKKYFAACSGKIFSLETYHFRNFASRNCENDMSLKILSGAKRREKTFTQTYNRLKPSGLREKSFFGASRQIKVLNRRVFHDFASQNHEKHVGLKIK